MIRDLSNVPGALTFNDIADPVGKFAVSVSAMRGALVGSMLGRIMRLTEDRVYYGREIDGVLVKESWAKRSSVAFVLDDEKEYDLIYNLDRERVRQMDDFKARRNEDFRNKIILYNATGKI